MISRSRVKTVVAVPARLQSSRLPNKMLADIGGKSMIRRVLERSSQAGGVDAVVLCTDSDLVQQLALDWGFPVLMTSENCTSGSERIASVADQLMDLVMCGRAGSVRGRSAHDMMKFVSGMRMPTIAKNPIER